MMNRNAIKRGHRTAAAVVLAGILAGSAGAVTEKAVTRLDWSFGPARILSSLPEPALRQLASTGSVDITNLSPDVKAGVVSGVKRLTPGKSYASFFPPMDQARVSVALRPQLWVTIKGSNIEKPLEIQIADVNTSPLTNKQISREKPILKPFPAPESQLAAASPEEKADPHWLTTSILTWLQPLAGPALPAQAAPDQPLFPYSSLVAGKEWKVDQLTPEQQQWLKSVYEAYRGALSSLQSTDFAPNKGSVKILDGIRVDLNALALPELPPWGEIGQTVAKVQVPVELRVNAVVPGDEDRNGLGWVLH